MNGLAVAVVAAVPGLIGALLAYQQASRANRQTILMEARKVDAAAYERAQHIWEAGYTQLERQLHLLDKQLQQEQSVSSMLRLRLQQVETTLAVFRRHMADAGIAIPEIPEEGPA